MGPEDLAQVLRHLTCTGLDPDLLVGWNTGDDAGVYRLREDLALILTVDYFTPVVDEPYDFGQIAAANAMSDVYAMGGQPLLALNLAGFPAGKLNLSVLAEILRGGEDKIREAGALLVGGHTVEDAEPKYGLAVVGLVHPGRVVTNAGARPGDDLVLTKPIGAGVLTTALKKDEAPPQAVEGAVRVMATLNAAGAQAMQRVGVNACTDITGFELLGHAREMARASGVGLEIRADSVPLLKEAEELAARGFFPGGAHKNRAYFAPYVELARPLAEHLELLLFDPMTSGGLLMAVPSSRTAALLEAPELSTRRPAVIGRVREGPAGIIKVL